MYVTGSATVLHDLRFEAYSNQNRISCFKIKIIIGRIKLPKPLKS